MSGNSIEVDDPDRLDGLPLLLFVVVGMSVNPKGKVLWFNRLID